MKRLNLILERARKLFPSIWSMRMYHRWMETEKVRTKTKTKRSKKEVKRKKNLDQDSKLFWKNLNLTKLRSLRRIAVQLS